MNEFDLYVDSSTDLTDELIEKYDIDVIPFSYSIKGVEKLCYEKGVPFEETAKKYYAAMRAGEEIKTSLVDAHRIIEHITPSAKKGVDAVIVTIASGVSGTYGQAIEAKKQLEAEYEGFKLHIVDSANSGMGGGLVALEVARLRENGVPAEECAEKANDFAYYINSYFTVSDLKYLKRGGRISATLAIAGTILNIKPLIKADGGKNAKLAMSGSAHGRKRSLEAIIDAYKKRAIHPEEHVAAISHADCEEDAKKLAEAVKALGAKDIIINQLDLCSGAHGGPGMISLFFYGSDRRSDDNKKRFFN